MIGGHLILLFFSGGPIASVASGAGIITFGEDQIRVYDKGDLVPITWEFTDADTGGVVDPDHVFFRYVTPAGVINEWEYGVDPELVKDSVGNYEVELSAAESGDWHYEASSTGEGQAVAAWQFVVRPSMFQ